MNNQKNVFYNLPKTLNYIALTLKENTVELLIFLYVLSIFFLEVSLIPNRVVLGAILLCSLVDYFKKRPKFSWMKSKMLTLFFFLLPLLYSLLNACSADTVILNSTIPIFLFILHSSTFAQKSTMHAFYRALNISLGIILLICLSNVFIEIWQAKPKIWWNFFVHNSFLKSLNLHPSYVSMFALVAISGNLNRFYKEIITDKTSYRSIFLLLMSITFLLLASSKMAYVVLLIFLILFVTRLFVAKKYKWALGFLLGAIMSLMALNVALPSIKYRITIDYKTFVQNDFQLDNKSPASERIYLWKTSLQNIKEYPLGRFCVDTKKQIWLTFQKTNKKRLVQKNAHNNFLEFGLIYGVAGILLLIVFVFIAIHSFWKTKDQLFLGVLIIFLLFSLTESTLVREMGVIYMALVFQLHTVHLKRHR